MHFIWTPFFRQSTNKTRMIEQFQSFKFQQPNVHSPNKVIANFVVNHHRSKSCVMTTTIKKTTTLKLFYGFPHWNEIFVYTFENTYRYDRDLRVIVLYRSSGNSLDNLDSSDCFLSLRCFCDRFDNINSIIHLVLLFSSTYRKKYRQNRFISVKTKDKEKMGINELFGMAIFWGHNRSRIKNKIIFLGHSWAHSWSSCFRFQSTIIQLFELLISRKPHRSISFTLFCCFILFFKFSLASKNLITISFYHSRCAFFLNF